MSHARKREIALALVRAHPDMNNWEIRSEALYQHVLLSWRDIQIARARLEYEQALRILRV